MTDIHDDVDQHEDQGARGEQEAAEESARLRGWKPLEEFRGDPNQWRDAKEFLEINDRSAPVMKETINRLERQIKHLTRSSNAADERWRGQERDRIRAELRSAAANGDEERADKLGQELERASAPAPASQPPPEVDAFRDRNPWFGVDREKTAEAQFLSQQVRQMNPDWSVADELQAVEREMQRRYPTRQPSQDRQRAAAPDQPADGVRLAPRTVSGFDKLPYAAKQQFNYMVERGVYKATAEDKEMYAADYDSPVVVVERKRTA